MPPWIASWRRSPACLWNFSQPIADNMEEAVSGVKGELAVKLYGDDLKTLEAKGDEIVGVMRKIKGIQDLGLFRVIGQPNLNFIVDRKQAARYQINVADVQDAIQTAVGGNALTQVLQGEQRYDLVMRYLPQYRDTKEAIEKIRLVAPSGERVSLAQLCKIDVSDGASEIYREGNSRYVAIKYSVRGRDLGSTVEEAIEKVEPQWCNLPPGYHLSWAGEYESAKRANKRLSVIVPITVLVIFMLLYSAFNSFKWASLVLLTVALAPVGGLVCAIPDQRPFQRLLGRGISGAVRSFSADGRDHGGVHQPASRARPLGSGCGGGRRGASPAADHDDHACGDARPFARGDVARHRLGFAASLCHRHRGWIERDAGDEHFPAAHGVRVDCARSDKLPEPEPDFEGG